MENGKSNGNPLSVFACALVAGIAVGAVLALGLSEESKYRIRKAAFELKELPFRFFL